MIDYADKDRDGGINFEEFVATVTRQYPKVWLYDCCENLLLNYLIYFKLFIHIQSNLLPSERKF